MNRKQLLGRGLLTFCCLAALTGCYEYHEEHRPAYGYGSPPPPPPPVAYEYYYYPDEEVYYLPSRRIYYWRDGDEWRHDIHRPPRIVLHERVKVRIRSEEPFKEHDEIRRQYPGHRREEREERERR